MIACSRRLLVLGCRPQPVRAVESPTYRLLLGLSRAQGIIPSCSNQPLGNSAGDSSRRELATSQPAVKFNVRPLSKDDVDIQFARSSGPGGQNVNKVNTKVDMRFDFSKASWLPDEVKEAVRRMEKNKITKDGLLVVNSTKHRTQSQNLDDALSKIQQIIDAAVLAVTPKEVDPETRERVKQQIKAGKERRLDDKKKESQRKTERRSKDFW